MVVRDAWPVWARVPPQHLGPASTASSTGWSCNTSSSSSSAVGLFAPIGLVVSLRTTPETLVRQAQIPDEVDRTRSVHQVSHQLDVSTPLTPAEGHLCCLDLGRCAEGVSHLLNCPVVCLLGTRVCSTWSPRASSLNYLQAHVDAGKDAMAGSAHPQQGRRSVRDFLIPAPSTDRRIS